MSRSRANGDFSNNSTLSRGHGGGCDSYKSGSDSSRDELFGKKMEEDDEEDDDEEDDEDDDEDNAPTPVNEGMATDDFQWVRSAPVPYRARPVTVPSNPEDFGSVGRRYVESQRRRQVTRPATDTYQQRHVQPTASLTNRGSQALRLPSPVKPMTPAVYESPYYSPSSCHHHHPPPPMAPLTHVCCYPTYWYDDVPYLNACAGCEVGVGGVSHHRCVVPHSLNKRHSHHGFQYLDATGLPSPGRGEFLPLTAASSPGRTPLFHRDKATCCPEGFHSTSLVASPVLRKGLSGGNEYEDVHEKIRMLQTEKENLILQVTVLTEQVEAQGERIRELDSTLEDRKEQLDGTEEMLQQEMLARSSLENSKLDYVGQLAETKRKLNAAEREKLDYLEKCKKLEAELIIAKSRIVEKDAELATLKARLARNGTITPVNDHHRNHEVEKLKSALESLMISKEEKEKRIEELTLMVSRQKRIHDWLPSERRASEPSSPDAHGDSLYSPSGESNKSEHRLTEKPPQVPRLPNLTSTPVSSPSGGGQWSDPRYSPSPSQGSLKSISKANSSENVTPTGTRTPPAKRHYSTIPRQHGVQVLHQIQQQLQQHHRVDSTLSSASAAPLSTNVNKGSEPVTPQSKSYHNLSNTGNNSLGTPNTNSRRDSNKSTGVSFASEPEIVPAPSDDETSSQIMSSTLPPDSSLPKMEPKDKNKGFKRIFGKLKRSGSHTMDLKEGEFKRGGVRSTAGPRLGWSVDLNKMDKPEKPFSEWNTDTIIEWLNGMGLSTYSVDCKRWVKNGEHFLKATPHDMEKELGIKNVLHRKKLQLALQAKGAKKPEKGKDKQPITDLNPILEKALGKLDHHWVVRWLDDVGLPQYKDSFVDARVDGRMLHFLTVEDLFALKVTNLLHHVSIKRGIQVLRENKYDPYCLKRRSLPDENKDYKPVHVVLWTNHRVMEWLKTVDLSEYAPNLRGSGVHGALIVYESKFNAELLAALLNIPPSKTLLRRHLTTQFKSLVGPALMQEKRDCEMLQDGVSNPPLTPNTKVKAVHKGQFTLLRKKNKGEMAFEDFVCPMSLSPPKSMSVSGETQVDSKKTEHTAEEIGAVSKDISSLTNKLQEERLLSAMETTNV